MSPSFLGDLLVSRHSCRAFLAQEVPSGHLTEIFRLAQQAPSWCNTQPWHTTVLSGAARDHLSHQLLRVTGSQERSPDLPPPQAYPGVYGERRRQSGYGLYASLGIDRHDYSRRAEQARENFRFFGAPHVGIISVNKQLGPYGALDCGGYITALLLAAESLGVATVAQAAVAMYAEVVRKVLELPEDRQILAAISLGYEDLAHPANNYRAPRAEISEAVSWIRDQPEPANDL